MEGKILVVDDEKEITDLVTLYLENEGFQVFKFYDSRKAMNYAERDGLGCTGYYDAGDRRPGIV